jgi:hypothetical protein
MIICANTEKQSGTPSPPAIQFSDHTGSPWWVTTKSGTHAVRQAPVWKTWMHPQYLASQASIVSCNADLLRALRGEAPAETMAEDNLKTVRLTRAAYESSSSGKAIEMSAGRCSAGVGSVVRGGKKQGAVREQPPEGTNEPA